MDGDTVWVGVPLLLVRVGMGKLTVLPIAPFASQTSKIDRHVGRSRHLHRCENSSWSVRHKNNCVVVVPSRVSHFWNYICRFKELKV